MNDEQREGVRDTARYLRHVRPLDPEELSEYVPGQPHPATVAQVLREEAFDLGLVERGDGTFVPVEDEPIDAAFDGVDALPEQHGHRVADLLVEEFGPGWPEGQSGDRLRERIRTIKRRYHRGADVEYDRHTALGYAIYHLPATYAAAGRVLADVADDDLLPKPLRVFDVGAGVGGPALALFDLLPEDALVDYHAIEPSAAADVLESMLEGVGRNVHATVHRTPIEDADLGALAGDAGVDLALLANVLNELDEPAETLQRVLDALAPSGTAVAIEPADRNTATGLRTAERVVADDGPATVYAPTVRLWPNRAPEGECWSFDVGPDVAVPAFQRRLDDADDGAEHDPGEFVNVDVQYAFSVLRTDGRRWTDVTASRDRYAPLGDADEFVTERVNLVAVKLSHDLAEDGHPLFLIGDGSEAVDHFAVRTDDSSLTDSLETAPYGSLLHLKSALVLWNDDEEAYNAVVDEEAVVDVVAQYR